MMMKNNYMHELELLQIAAKEGWEEVSLKYNSLSPDFLIKYKDKLNWEHCSCTQQNLSEEMILKLDGYFQWHCIGAYHTVSHDFIWEHRHRMENWYNIFECLDITTEFALKLVDDLGIELLKDVCLNDIIDFE